VALGTELIEQYPDSFLIRLQLARALKEGQALLRAETVLSFMSARYGDNITFLIERGDVLRRLGRLGDAEADFQKILFLDPFNTKARAALEEIQAEQKTQGDVAFEVVDYSRAEFKDDQTVPELFLKTDKVPEPVAYEPVIDLDAEPENDSFFNPVDRPPEEDVADEESALIPRIEDEPQVELDEEPLMDAFGSVEADLDFSSAQDQPHDRWIQVDIAAAPQEPPPSDFRESEPPSEPVFDSFQDMESKKEPQAEPEPELFSEPKPEPVGTSMNHEMGFVTESAARLYAQQGLYVEALAIYERLGQVSNPEKYHPQMARIKGKISAERQLAYFKKMLTQFTTDRGSYFV
jgi:tetratricopeptide (TPR) repeat protein